MEILNNFGFNPYLLVAQIINFLIVLFVLRKFLYKPMLNLLKNRQKTIEEGLKNAEKGNKALGEALEEEKEILKRAQIQGQKLIKEVQKQAEETLRNSEEYARKQADMILKDARIEISQEMKEAEKQLTVQVSRLAIDFLQKSIHGLFGEKEQEEILVKAIKKLKEKPN